MAPSMASVPLLMKKAFWRSPGVTMASSLAKAGAPGLQQLLAVERHTPHLIGDGLHDLRVIHSGAEDAVPAEAVDVLSAQQVLEEGPAAGPLDRGELPRLRDRLSDS